MGRFAEEAQPADERQYPCKERGQARHTSSFFLVHLLAKGCAIEGEKQISFLLALKQPRHHGAPAGRRERDDPDFPRDGAARVLVRVARAHARPAAHSSARQPAAATLPAAGCARPGRPDRVRAPAARPRGHWLRQGSLLCGSRRGPPRPERAGHRDPRPFGGGGEPSLYATQRSNPSRPSTAQPARHGSRQVCYPHVGASPWTGQLSGTGNLRFVAGSANVRLGPNPGPVARALSLPLPLPPTLTLSKCCSALPSYP